MKTLKIYFSIILFLPLSAFASCGDMPTPPQLLELPQLQQAQVNEVEVELKGFFSEVEMYRACIDQEIARLAPDNAPTEYFDSPEYQTQFDNYAQLSDEAQARMTIVIERYNYLLQIVSQ